MPIRLRRKDEHGSSRVRQSEQTSTDPSTIADRAEHANTTTNGDGLCAKCSTLDFLDGEGRYETTLKEARRNRCATCSVFVSKIEHKLDLRHIDAAKIENRKFLVSLFPEQLVVNSTMRSNLKPYFHFFGRFDIAILDKPSPYTKSAEVVLDTFDCEHIKAWMSDCLEHHNHAADKGGWKGPLLPLVEQRLFRLIDVCTLDVIAVRDLEEVRFAALSYVWGGVKVLEGCATEDNGNLPPCDKGDRVLRLVRHKLPKTIGDAIRLTENLGLAYLWVDQICINQSVHAAKNTVVASMGAVYAGAEVVICAAGGKDSDAGLPGVTPGSRSKKGAIFTHRGKYFVISDSWRISTELNNSTWWERAWTFQEFYLARRSLLLFPSGVTFKCESIWKKESVQEPQWWPLEVFRGPDVDGSSFVNALEDYSNRELTFEDDRLAALAGFIAQYFPGDSLATKTGMPLQAFNKLLWWRMTTSERQRLRPEAQIAPSWSWASAAGPIYLPITLRTNGFNTRVFDFTEEPRSNVVIGLPAAQFWCPQFGHSSYSGMESIKRMILYAGWDLWHHQHARVQTYALRHSYPPELRSARSWAPAVDRLQASTRVTATPFPVLHLVAIVFRAAIERRSGGVWRSVPPLDHLEFFPDSDSQAVAEAQEFAIVYDSFGSRGRAMQTTSCLLLRRCGRFCERAGLLEIVHRISGRHSFRNSLRALLEDKASEARWEYLELR